MPDEPYFQRVLKSYFPEAITSRYADRLASHPLRREIITTVVVNRIINRGGITFGFRAIEESGATTVEIARAHTVAREVFGLDEFWAKVAELDNVVPVRAQSGSTSRAGDFSIVPLDGCCRAGGRCSTSRLRSSTLPRSRDWSTRSPRCCRGSEQERLLRRAAEYTAQGVPDELAMVTSAHLDAFSLLDIVELANTAGQQADDVGFVYFALSDRFEVDKMLNRITELPRDERWHALARMALRYDLYGALAGLTVERADADTRRWQPRRAHHRLGERQRRRSGASPHDAARDRVQRQLRSRHVVRGLACGPNLGLLPSAAGD